MVIYKKGMVLEQSSKAVLIEFIRRSGVCLRYRSTQELEVELLNIQYDLEVDASLNECDTALVDRKKYIWSSPEYKETVQRWNRGNARYKRAEKLYEIIKKLRGY